MSGLRLSASVLGLVLSTGWLWADSIIPGDGSVGFTKGGNHTTTITGFGVTPLTGDPPIGEDGSGSYGVINGTGQTIDHIVFDIPTTNFDQPFFASTDLFTNASIQLDPAHDLVIVTFFGTGFAAHGGTAFIPAPCDDDCESTFSLPLVRPSIGPPPPLAVLHFFGGFEPGPDNESTLTLLPDPNSPGSGFTPGGVPSAQFIPEPATFALLLTSGLAVALGRRKFSKR